MVYFFWVAIPSIVLLAFLYFCLYRNFKVKKLIGMVLEAEHSLCEAHCSKVDYFLQASKSNTANCELRRGELMDRVCSGSLSNDSAVEILSKEFPVETLEGLREMIEQELELCNRYSALPISDGLADMYDAMVMSFRPVTAREWLSVINYYLLEKYLPTEEQRGLE